MLGFTNCIFNTEALEIFKKIVLSCTAKHELLQILTPFFMMKLPVTLNDTYKFILTGSQTIADYMLENPKMIISGEDILMAFSGKPHYRKMHKIYNTKTNDFWIENYSLDDYMISHLIKPISIVKFSPKKNMAIAKYLDPKIDLELIGIKNFHKFKPNKIYFVHFGLIVYETDDKILAKKIMDVQKQYMNNLTREPFRITYANYGNKELKEIYKRNISFYLSSKNAA